LVDGAGVKWTQSVAGEKYMDDSSEEEEEEGYDEDAEGEDGEAGE